MWLPPVLLTSPTASARKRFVKSSETKMPAASCLVKTLSGAKSAALRRSRSPMRAATSSFLSAVAVLMSPERASRGLDSCRDQRRMCSARASNMEATPDTAPDDFKPVKGSKAKRNVHSGEIWELDLFHRDHEALICRHIRI